MDKKSSTIQALESVPIGVASEGLSALHWRYSRKEQEPGTTFLTIISFS